MPPDTQYSVVPLPEYGGVVSEGQVSIYPHLVCDDAEARRMCRLVLEQRDTVKAAGAQGPSLP